MSSDDAVDDDSAKLIRYRKLLIARGGDEELERV